MHVHDPGDEPPAHDLRIGIADDDDADVAAVQSGRQLLQHAAALVRADRADDRHDVLGRPRREIFRRVENRPVGAPAQAWRDHGRLDSSRARERDIENELRRHDHGRCVLERRAHPEDPVGLGLRHSGRIEGARIDELQVVQRDHVGRRSRPLQRIEMRATPFVDAVHVQDADARELEPAAQRVHIDVRIAEVRERRESAGADVLGHGGPAPDVQDMVLASRARSEIADVAVRAAARRGGDVQHRGSGLCSGQAHQRRRKQRSRTW